jgi:hypothetical protein
MAQYLVLQVSNALSSKPTVHYHICRNDTNREEVAITIFNNKELYGYPRFNPETDLLLPLTIQGGLIDVKTFNREDLEDEEDEDNDDNDDNEDSSNEASSKIEEPVRTTRSRRRPRFIDNDDF